MREMKDSGIEWIGKIPKNWSILKLKYVLKFSGSGTTPSSNKLEFYDGDIEWIQSGDLYHTNTIVNTKVKLKSLALKYFPALKFYKAPFIVIAMYGASVGNVSISGINACTNQACCVLYPNNENNLKFLYYWIVIAKNELLKKSIGGGQPNINQITIKNLNFINLPYKNQQAIADFLDAKCADIDSLTGDIQKQIDILKEYKKSIITQAVTKGIDPNVEMKDSGVAWIGKIPMTWHIVRLKYLTTDIFDIDHYMPKDSNEEDSIPYLMIGDLRENLSSVKFSKCKKISKRDYLSLSKKNKSQIGDVVFARYATIGTVCYIDLNKNFLVSYACLTIKPKKHILGKYLYYYLKSNDFYNEAMGIINANTQGNIGKESLRNVGIVLPNLQLQEKIINFLDSKCADIDAAIASKQKQLDVLKEYKKSLIYEYVTGKKEVPCRE